MWSAPLPNKAIFWPLLPDELSPDERQTRVFSYNDSGDFALLNFGAVLMGLQGAGTGMLDRGIEKYKREEELWEMKASASQSNPLADQPQILQLLD